MIAGTIDSELNTGADNLSIGCTIVTSSWLLRQTTLELQKLWTSDKAGVIAAVNQRRDDIK